MLTFEELKALVETGEVDTVVVAFTDMQGRLMGKRLHGEFFVEEMEAEHPVEGCNYLLALEMEMDPVPGLRDRELGAGLRRLRDQARPGDAAADPLARGDRARARRRALARRLTRAALAAAGAARADGARRGARLHADGRLGARVLPPQGDLLGGAREGLQRPDAVRARTSSTTTSSARPTTSRCSARSATGCRPPASGSRRRRARRGPGSRRSTSASPTR